MKKFCLMWICILLCVFLIACKDYSGNRPVDQPNTTWVSNDESIVITVNADRIATGYFISNGQQVDFLFEPCPVTIFIARLDKSVLNEDPSAILGSIEEGDTIEKWEADFSHDDHFTITVIETTYFEIGQEIEFYRKD